MKSTTVRFRGVLLTLALTLVTACSSNGADPTTTTESTTSSSGAAATSTTTTAPATTTTIPTTTTSTTPTTSTTLPEFPQAKDPLEHGGDAWAVYLAVADDFGDSSLDEASSLADSYGYFAGVSDINCDQGAAAAVGVPSGGSEAVVGVYFDSELDANQFVLAYEARGHTVAGTGLVQTYCLD
jgi:hypothetical protein